MRVLIVEDDPKIVSFVDRGLRAEGYGTVVASNAHQARSFTELTPGDVDLVLLDLGLPDGSGEDLLRRMRHGGSTVPVIILTARSEVSDKVRGLDSGANDYMTKPFAFEELLARIRALIRSADQPSAAELVVGDLRFDLLTKMAFRAGRTIELAPREWALLELFMRHPRQILSRTRILSEVWEYGFEPGSNVVDVYVGYLRRKVNRPGLRALIQTVRGSGYRLLPTESAGGSRRETPGQPSR